MVELWTLATLGKCELMLGLLAPNLPFMREAREEKKKVLQMGDDLIPKGYYTLLNILGSHK